jgi:hypothetical protein
VVGQRGKAAGGQGAQERVQFLPGRGIAEAPLGGRREIAEGEADGVVVDEAERQGGLPGGQPRRAERREEGLGQGQRCRADRVACLQQGGDAGMVFQDRPQPPRESGDLRHPRRARVCLAVDFGEHRVEDKVVKLFLAAHVAVQRAGYHAKPGGDGAHAEGLRAVRADDGQGLGDDALASERPAGALPVVRGVEP